MERIMKKPELADELAARTGFYKKNMREVVEALADIVLESLQTAGVGDDEHIEYGVGVDELADYGADEEAISIIRNLADGAQEFVDKVWELINYTCTAYPDDEWISETLDGNPNSFTFIVDDNGDVEDIN
jgi:hypothetical protein